MTRGNCGVQFFLHTPEERSTALHMTRNYKLLVDIRGTQSLGPRLFEPCCLYQTLACIFITIQVVCAIGRVRLGAFDVSACVIKPAFIAKQTRQLVMNPKQLHVPVERGRDLESYLKMVNCFLSFALGMIYAAKNTMRFADPVFFTCLWE